MKKLILLSAVLLGVVSASRAGGGFSFGFSIPLGSPSYQAPPVYAAPAPVYSAPAPVYQAPPVYCYPPPVVYAPPPTIYFGYGYGWHGSYGHWGYHGGSGHAHWHR